LRIRDNNRDLKSEESALAEYRRRRAELVSDAAQSGSDKAMQGILDEIRAVEKSIARQSAAQYISAYSTQIAEADARLKSMHDEHGPIQGFKRSRRRV
jgi:hypothetical protein